MVNTGRPARLEAVASARLTFGVEEGAGGGTSGMC